jgi:hypothetical protein
MAVRGTAGSRLVTAWNSGRRFAGEHQGFVAMLVVVVSFVAWIVDVIVAPTLIGLATRGWPDERLLDPSLGSHMGSEATRFDVQVAQVLVFLVPWVTVGVVVAIKTKTLVAAIVPAAVPAVVSTWLYFATGTSSCELGDFGATDFIFLVSVGLAAVLAYAGGAIAGRGERRPVVAIAILVASSLTILDHVQWSNCSGFSTQVSRELEAVLMFGFFLAGAAAIASLGRLTARIVRNRRSHQTHGAPIA